MDFEDLMTEHYACTASRGLVTSHAAAVTLLTQVTSDLSADRFPKEFVYKLWIRFPTSGLHDLANEKSDSTALT